MSKFIGRRYSSDGYGGGGVTDHGALTGLGDDDHLSYLIVSSVRIEDSPTSGINKTGLGAGDVFTLVNAGTGSALYIRQTGTVSTADAAVDIDNTGNIGRALSVFTSTTDPDLPLVQFSALSSSFDEPILLLTHADPRGLTIDVRGDGYLSGVLDGPMALTFTGLEDNPIELGETGIYVESDTFYYVDSDGNKHTFSLDEKVKISANDTTTDYLREKIQAGTNITISEVNDGGDEHLVISSTATGGGETIIAGDGYFPFIEVDELVMSGDGSGTLPNTTGSDTDSSITRDKYNEFSIGDGLLEIKGLTLRSTIDADLHPEITYTVWKNSTLIDDDVANTVLSGGTLLFEDEPTTENETYITGNRKDGEIQFTTGEIDFDDAKFATGDGNPDGYFYFVFSGDHTYDTKTILVKRFTVGGRVENITFTYPTCSFTGALQTDVRAGQTFDVEVTTVLDGYAPVTSARVDAGDAVQSTVWLSETTPGSGVWTGTVTARTGQSNGLADINVTVFDAFANSFSTNTTETGDPLVSFDNDFPVIEAFSEASDLSYPPGQSCLKYGEWLDAYMTASDFTEILYTSQTGRISIDNPTTYEDVKVMTWDQGVGNIEENANILVAASVDNVHIRARKGTNCSETTRNIQIRLDDTPPAITSVRWRRNNVGIYNLTSPTLGVGTHGVCVVFNDPLIELPEIIVQDENKGTLSVFSGSVPGTTFTATLTVTDPGDTDGCTELVLVTGINCSHKLPLDADPISGTQEEYCVDVTAPKIDLVEIDIDKSDGYWNDGYDGYNLMNDDSNNLENTVTACELDFSSGVQTMFAPDIYTRHGENVVTTVKMATPIQPDETCVFDASPWGASASTNLPQLDGWLWQGTFTTALGGLRNDDQGRNIGRASIWHETGNDATVIDSALNSDSATNQDVLSANGVDDIANSIAFATDGTSTGTFTVSVDSFRALMKGRVLKIEDDNSSPVIRTVREAQVDGSYGVISTDGGSLANFTVAQNARVTPLGMTDAEIQAWDANNGLIAYVNDGAFTKLTVCDWANPEAFSQHLSDDQLTENHRDGSVGEDLFRAAFWGSKISVPNTHGGTEANPTGAPDSQYVWRSKKLRLTNNPTGVQGTNLRFMVFGFSAGTSYRNVNITSTSDWDQNSARFDLGNNDSQIDVRISVDEPFAAGVQPIHNANWYLTTDYEVSPQSGFKFGKTKDINIVFSPPASDVVDKDIYVEITLKTNSSGKAPQIDLFAFAYLT